MSPPTESVWDYPRPPRAEPSADTVEIVLGGRVVARSARTVRVLETSHPPTDYVPTADFDVEVLQPAAGSSWCEWKGLAGYYDLVGGEVRADQAGWTYPRPSAGFAILLDPVAVYPGRVDRCTVNGEVVRRRRAASTAGGSPTGSSGLSRVSRGLPAGEPGQPRPVVAAHYPRPS